jgi:coenzyme PQQ synthesis protein D (PqqD)
LAALKPKTREDLDVVELGDEAVVYDGRSGRLHHLNATAWLVFQLYDGSATIKQTAEDLAGAFDLPAGEVERRVRAVHREFREAELLERKHVPAESEPVAEEAAPDEREQVRMQVPRSD